MKEKFKELLQDERSEGPAPTDTGMARFFKEIGAELKHQAEAGAHEMAAALFRGDAFVMYGKEGQNNEGHGLPVEAAKQPEMEPEMER